MVTLTTSSSARESRKTRRMMSRALSFPWVGAGMGRQTMRAVARRRPARGSLHVRFGLAARTRTLVKDTRADGGQGRSAHHVADPRVASERNQEERGDEHPGKGVGREGGLDLYPRRAHLPVQVDA